MSAKKIIEITLLAHGPHISKGDKSKWLEYDGHLSIEKISLKIPRFTSVFCPDKIRTTETVKLLGLNYKKIEVTSDKQMINDVNGTPNRLLSALKKIYQQCDMNDQILLVISRQDVIAAYWLMMSSEQKSKKILEKVNDFSSYLYAIWAESLIPGNYIKSCQQLILHKFIFNGDQLTQ